MVPAVIPGIAKPERQVGVEGIDVCYRLANVTLKSVVAGEVGGVLVLAFDAAAGELGEAWGDVGIDFHDRDP